MPNKRPGNQNRSTSNGTSAKKLKYQDDSDDDDYDKAEYAIPQSLPLLCIVN